MTSSRVFACLAVLFAFAAAAPRVSAQVRMKCSLDHVTYLRFEPVNLTCTIENQSGNVLDFGDKDNPKGSLYVEIFDGKRRYRSNWNVRNGRREQYNPLIGVSISPGTRQTVEVPLDLFHDITEPGDYEVKVVIQHKRMKYEFESTPLRFQVRDGEQFWSRSLGVPTRDPDAEIQMRNVEIFTMRTVEGYVAFLQISDELTVYSTVRIGSIVMGSPIELEVDTLSQVHMLVPVQSRIITYFVFDIHGRRTDYRNYRALNAASVPTLSRDPDIGRVMVVGGTPVVQPEKFDAEDLPIMKIR